VLLFAAGNVAGGAGGTALHIGGPQGLHLVAQLADAAELAMGVGGVVYVQVRIWVCGDNGRGRVGVYVQMRIWV
jgi:hypothetical protein